MHASLDTIGGHEVLHIHVPSPVLSRETHARFDRIVAKIRLPAEAFARLILANDPDIIALCALTPSERQSLMFRVAYEIEPAHLQMTAALLQTAMANVGRLG